jgi:hypothetical protein
MTTMTTTTTTTTMMKMTTAMTMTTTATKSTLMATARPWRNDDQSTIAVFLHLNFSGRVVIDYANPNDMNLHPMLWRHPIDARVYV